MLPVPSITRKRTAPPSAPSAVASLSSSSSVASSTASRKTARRHDAHDDNIEESNDRVGAPRRSLRQSHIVAAQPSPATSAASSSPRVARRHITLSLEDDDTKTAIVSSTLPPLEGDDSSIPAASSSTPATTAKSKSQTKSQPRVPAELLAIMPSLPAVRAGEPANWRAQLWAIQRMRMPIPTGQESSFTNDPGRIGVAANAPVDTMGCSALGDRTASPAVFRFQTLVALMLSSQTRDAVTAVAMTNLKRHGLTVDNILRTPQAKIDELIKMVGFHAKKAEYLKKTAQMLKDKYDSDIPNTVADLCKLSGVGPKMAHLTMLAAWNDHTSGIGVDVHVHRISGRLGWTNPNKAKKPEDTRKILEGWLPKEYWPTINKLLVGFGQTICGFRPLCHNCSALSWCPTGQKMMRSKSGAAARNKRKSPVQSTLMLQSSNESKDEADDKKDIKDIKVKRQRSSTKKEEAVTTSDDDDTDHSAASSSSSSDHHQVKSESSSSSSSSRTVKREGKTPVSSSSVKSNNDDTIDVDESSDTETPAAAAAVVPSSRSARAAARQIVKSKYF